MPIIASSGVFVRPTGTKPSARKRSAKPAVDGRASGIAERPHALVMRLARLLAQPKSLNRNGTPVNGPSGSGPDRVGEGTLELAVDDRC